MEKPSKCLKEHTIRMEDVKQVMKQQKKHTKRLTYASVLANGSSKGKETLHSVVVTSTEEDVTGEEVLDRIRKAKCKRRMGNRPKD